METKLARIALLSRENPQMAFTSIGHLINVEMLKECHGKMDGTKAVGIDGITKDEYTKHLDENLENLVERLKRKSYKPKPARLIEIPKDNGKTRMLSIYCYEDKLVQEALRRILEAVFEPMFYDEMMGFRPNRGCHMALRKLNTMIERERTSYILEIQYPEIEMIRKLILRRKLMSTQRLVRPLVTWGARCRKAARRDLLGARSARDTSTNQ